MSPTDPSASHRPSIAPGRPAEVGLVVVDVGYDERLYASYSDDDLRCAKAIVGEAFRAVAEAHGGSLFSWEGDRGVFLFPVEEGEGLDGCGRAALLMLDLVPSLSEDLRSSADLDRPIAVRVACDAGEVPAGAEVRGVCRRLLSGLSKCEPPRGDDDAVTITGRIHGRLPRELQGRFVGRRYSNAMGVELHSTSAFAFPAVAPAVAAAPELRVPALLDSATASGSSSGLLAVAPGVPEEGPIRGREAAVGVPARAAGRPWPWFVAGVAVAALVLGGVSLVWRGGSPGSATAGLSARDAEWASWRALVRERLGDEEPTEEDLRQVLDARPPASAGSPSDELRRDQAAADVLLGSKGVRAILKQLVGIDEHFLGTGLSNPVGGTDYRQASVHEYLIKNLPDNAPNVWMTRLDPFALEMDTPIRGLVEAGGEGHRALRGLDRVIASLCESKKRGSVVVRFALLEEAYYKNTLGHPDRVRVFASDLTEVWDLSVREAADRSGYTFKGGGTFFLWIVVPNHEGEAIPATWGRVFENLPGWMQEAKDRAGPARP